MWNWCDFGSKMTVHSFSWTSIHTEYFPFVSACPLTVMSLSTSSVVAQLAPGVQTSPSSMTVLGALPEAGGAFGQIAIRPRTCGRLYSTVRVVPSIVCAMTACSLARTWACADSGQCAEGRERRAR